MTVNTDSMGLIVYADGSARPNPGFSGYGLFGYSYKKTPRPKNTKHPTKGSLNFTDNGIQKEKTQTPIEVLDIYEMCVALPSDASTNNIAELKAAIRALEWALETPQIKTVLVISDSRYVVNNFTDNLKGWRSKGFVKQGGERLRNEDLWRQISDLSETLLLNEVHVRMQWVRAHSGDYGNELADSYSVIASNAARIHHAAQPLNEDLVLLEQRQSYAKFKNAYQNKDVIYYFKDLYFSSAEINDENHCLMTSVEDRSTVGRRCTDSLFAVSKGYVPKLINDLRTHYRSLPREYVCTCSINLKLLEDRDLLRIADVVDVRYMLVPMSNGVNNLALVNSTVPFLQENTMNYPFIVNISKLYGAINRMQDRPSDAALAYDITAMLASDGKLKLGNKDHYIDLQDLTQSSVVFSQRPIISVGFDFPNYLTLKKIEGDIVSVTVLLDKAADTNFYTVYTNIQLPDRHMCSVNMLDKYLAVSTPEDVPF